MMTQPKQPEDHPSHENAAPTVPDRDPTGVSPNGVPPEADAADATGLPTSERQSTEVTAHPDKHKT